MQSKKTNKKLPNNEWIFNHLEKTLKKKVHSSCPEPASNNNKSPNCNAEQIKTNPNQIPIAIHEDKKEKDVVLDLKKTINKEALLYPRKALPSAYQKKK